MRKRNGKVGVSRNDGKGVEVKCGESVSKIKLMGMHLEDEELVRGENEWKYRVECQQNTVLKWEGIWRIKWKEE